MKNIHRIFLGALVALGTSMSSTAFAGEGIVRGIESMPTIERANLTSHVANFKKGHSSVFLQLDNLRAAMPRLDKQKRGRFAVIAPAIVALGKDAAIPLLDRLALGDDAHADLSENAFVAWRLGVIEALGRLREERAVPVFAAIVKGPETNVDLLRATTMALARIGTKDALEPLFAAPADKRLFALYALGECRKEVTADLLAAELQKASDGASQQVIIDALGRIGSSWAWTTPELKASGAGESVRRKAARALVEVAPRLAPGLKGDLEVALAMVEHPETRAMIALEKKRVGQAQAFDALELKF